MDAFQRYDSNTMQLSQKAIDRALPACPFCKSEHPHWLLAASGYHHIRYRCDNCHAVLSSPAVETELQDIEALTVEALGCKCNDATLLYREHPVSYLRNMPPVERSFCGKCGSVIVGKPRFCGSCGALIHAAPVQEAPVPTPPVAAPVQEAPVPTPPVAAPVVAPPDAPAMSARRFPVASFVLMCFAMVFVCLGIFAFVATWTYQPTTVLFISMVNYCWSFGIYTMLIVGLATCRRKRNIVVGIAALLIGIFGLCRNTTNLVSYIQTLSYYGDSDWAYRLLLYYIPSAVVSLFMNLIMFPVGISYLVAKPGMRILKNGCLIAFLVLGALIPIAEPLALPTYYSWADWLGVLTSVLVSAVLPTALLLYTPFKNE